MKSTAPASRCGAAPSRLARTWRSWIAAALLLCAGSVFAQTPAIGSINPPSQVAGAAAFNLTVTGSGFSAGSTVRWNGADRTTTFNSTTSLIAAISASDVASAGTASVAVFNPGPGGGTSNAVSFSIPSQLTATPSSINVICNGGGNGSAMVMVSGGTGPYSYSWGPSGGSSAFASSLSAGNYWVTVTDAASQSLVQNFTISEPPALVMSPASPLPAGSVGATYSQTLTASGGVPGYTYTIAPGYPPGLSFSGGALTGIPTAAGTYSVSVTATDAHNCAISKSYSLTIASPTAPDAPTIGVATVGDAQATVTFTAPVSDGGAAISSYTVMAMPGGISGFGATSPVTVTGLTNGTAYTFTVTATNSAGTGAASAASNSVTPMAPQVITFANPGTQNFGTSPTLTATSTSLLAVTFTSSTTGVCTISSGGALTFVAIGACTINADQAGDGSFLAAPQANQSFTVTAVPPGAPTIGAATSGDSQATVTFTAPASNGGASIVGYTATANPGGATGTGVGSPIVVTGLTNGTAYTFNVTATNIAGIGAASAASNSVTPTSPSAVVFVTVPATGTYTTGQPLDFAVQWDQNVVVTGTPQVALIIGTTARYANYVSGSGTSVLGFRYTVQAGDGDGDGIQVTALVPNGGTIRSAGNANAILALNSIGSTVGVFVAGAPATITSALAATGTYGSPISTYTIAANNSPTSYNATGLPPGLSINTGNGQITGTPSDPLGSPYSATINAIGPGGTASGTLVFTIDKATLLITGLTASDKIYDATTTASVGYGGVSLAGRVGADVVGLDTAAVSASFPDRHAGTGKTVTISGLSLSGAQAGNYTIASTATASADIFAATLTYQAAPATSAFGAVPSGLAGVVIGFLPGDTEANATTGTTVFTTPATASSPPGAYPIDGSGLTANNGNYVFVQAAGNATALTIGAATQAITGFAANPAAPVFAPGATFTVSATGGASGNAVLFASATPAVCAASGSTITMLSAGTCSLTADQAGDANYTAAPQAMLGVTIGAGSQSITFGVQAGQTYVPKGTFELNPVATASGGLPVRYSAQTASVCSISGTTITMHSAGTCTIAADQAGDANYSAATQVMQDIAIGQAGQAIAGFAANPAAPVFAPGATFTVSATGGASGNAVLFASATPAVCVVSGSTATMLSAGACTLTADQAGDANHTAAPQAMLDIAIGKAQPALSWIGDIARMYGEPAFDLPDPTSSGAGAFSFASSDARVATVEGRTVILAGAGTTTLTATQVASANYQGGSIIITLTVGTRPDPAQDASVVAALQAQADASMRFVQAQQENIRGRVGQLRNGGDAWSNAVGLRIQGGVGQPGLSLDANQALGARPKLSDGWGFWTAGSIVLGQRDAQGFSQGFSFHSDGVTVGIDRRFGERVALGVVGGFGWNDVDFDDGHSSLDARQRSAAFYGLWQEAPWFIDGILGWGRLAFDIGRWSDGADAMAIGHREGEQQFASMTLGYDHRSDSGTFTGYGRLDASRTTLDAYREQGLGVYDLRYARQSLDSSTAALGLEGRYSVRTESMKLQPHWMLEWRQALQDGGDAGINYVAAPRGDDYVLGMRSYDDSALAFGAGLDMVFGRGWSLSFMLRHEQAGGRHASGVSFRLALGL